MDLFADLRSERLIVEAALRKNRTEILSTLMASSRGHPRQVMLLKIFAAEKRVEDALTIFRACPEKTACHYNTLINACVEIQDFSTMEQLIADAGAAKVADVTTCNMLIKSCIQRGDLKRGREIVDVMQAAGVTPNAVTFNELLNALIKTNRDGAWKLIGEMKEHGVKPDLVTCSILLKTIRQGSRVEDIQRILDLIEASGDPMDEIVLSSVCEACVRAGHKDLLLQQLTVHLVNRSFQLSTPYTFGSMIRSYGFARDLNRVWDMWNEMWMRCILPTPVTVGCMVEALVANDEPEAGYKLIQELLRDDTTRPLVNSVIYGSVLKGFSQQKRFKSIWSMQQEMRTSKVEFSIVTYNMLFNACAHSGEMWRVATLLSDMVTEGIEPGLATYCSIIKGYCMGNQLDRAFEVLDEMKTATRICPDEITYNTLIDGCARNWQYDRGVAVFEEMQTAGVPPTHFTLSILVKLSNRCKMLPKAFSFCEMFASKFQIRPNIFVYNNLIQACLAHDGVQRGLQVLEQMLCDKVRPDVRTFTMLFEACIGANEINDAAGLLRGAFLLRGAHPRFAKFGAALQPSGAPLPMELVIKVLNGIAGHCREERLAVQLLKDLQQFGLKFDPRMQMQLTTKAIRYPSRH
jgi:pentatricopeptide repeat protein